MIYVHQHSQETKLAPKVFFIKISHTNLTGKRICIWISSKNLSIDYFVHDGNKEFIKHQMDCL